MTSENLPYIFTMICGVIAAAFLTVPHSPLESVDERVNAHTKLSLAFLVVMALGCGLIVAGLWPHYRIAAVIVGALCVVGGSICFAALWRDR